MNKSKVCAALLCLALAPLAYAKKDKQLVLPDACGDDNAEFKVNLVDDRPELRAQDGKALLVIVEEGLGKHDIITRYAIDGAWVGATHGSSYFLVQGLRENTTYARLRKNMLDSTSPYASGWSL